MEMVVAWLISLYMLNFKIHLNGCTKYMYMFKRKVTGDSSRYCAKISFHLLCYI